MLGARQELGQEQGQGQAEVLMRVRAVAENIPLTALVALVDLLAVVAAVVVVGLPAARLYLCSRGTKKMRKFVNGAAAGRDSGADGPGRWMGQAWWSSS